jgi:hypothetical protein
VEEGLLLDRIALGSGGVAPRDIEFAAAVVADFADSGLAFRDGTAMSARETAEAIVVELLVESGFGFTDSFVENTAEGGHGDLVLILTRLYCGGFNKVRAGIEKYRASLDGQPRAAVPTFGCPQLCILQSLLPGGYWLWGRFVALEPLFGFLLNGCSLGHGETSGDKRGESLAGIVAAGAGEDGPEIRTVIVLLYASAAPVEGS